MTKSNQTYQRTWTAALTGVLCVTCAAQAAVTLPNGDFFQNGEFEEIHYGESGLAYLSLYLFTGELGVTESPVISAATTDLSYGYSFTGFGGSLATFTYTLGNDGPQSFTDLRFMVKIQADGSSSFIDTAHTVPVPWGTADNSDPAHFQIADFADGLNLSIVQNDRLDDSNGCSASCDVDMALQWNIPEIASGQIFQLTIGLSDNGLALSNRYLVAESVDSANTVLSFSGVVTSVPVPAAAWLFGSGVALLTARRSKRARGNVNK